MIPRSFQFPLGGAHLVLEGMLSLLDLRDSLTTHARGSGSVHCFKNLLQHWPPYIALINGRHHCSHHAPDTLEITPLFLSSEQRDKETPSQQTPGSGNANVPSQGFSQVGKEMDTSAFCLSPPIPLLSAYQPAGLGITK